MRDPNRNRSFVALALALVLTSLMITPEVEAGGRNINYSNSRGGSGSRNVQVGNGSRSASGSYTGARGRQFQHQGGGSYDRATGTYTGGHTVTGPAGNTKSFGTTATYDRASKTATYDVVGPNGGGGSRTVQYGGGQRQVNSKYTGAAGRSYGRSASQSYDPSTGSYSGANTVTGPNGRSATYGTQGQYNRTTGQGSYTTTGPNGGTVNSEVQVERY